jgi:hypothetical protein
MKNIRNNKSSIDITENGTPEMIIKSDIKQNQSHHNK